MTKRPFETMYTPREAATRLGITYPTVKKWILNGTIKSVLTPGGHHRIPESSLSEYLRSEQRPSPKLPGNTPFISGMNLLSGTIITLRSNGLTTEAVLAIGEKRVTAIIDSESVDELALHEGDAVTAMVKVSDVMIMR